MAQTSLRNPKRRRRCLSERATRLAKLINIDAPSVIVANDIAAFIRESSKLYGETLNTALAGILANAKAKQKR